MSIRTTLVISILVSVLSVNVGTVFASGQKSGSIPIDHRLRFERFTIEEGLSQNTVLDILQDKQGFIWLATQEGLDRYDGYDFTVFKNDPENSNSLSSSAILSLYEDQDGSIWIGTWGGGLNHYDPKTGQFTRYENDPYEPASLSNNIVTSIVPDASGNLWVGTCGGGLNELDIKTGKFRQFKYDSSDSLSLSSNNISVILKDAKKGLWIGTGCLGVEGNGLNHFFPETGHSAHFVHDESNSNTLSSNNVSSIIQDTDGNLWIGTGGYTLKGTGINKLNTKSFTFTRFHHNEANPSSLSNNNVTKMMLDPSGILWVGTWGSGLDLADTRKNPIRFYNQHNNPYDPQSVSSDIVWSFLQDRSGITWVGTANGGVNKVDPQVQAFGLYRNDPGNPQSLGFNAVGPTIEDRQNRTWVATLGGGLELFDRKTDTFQHFAITESDPFYRTKNTILALYQDRENRLWAGTLSGLAEFNPNIGSFTYYNHDPIDPKSIISDSVSGIQEDSYGRLWVSTLNGLDWFDRSTKQFTHIKIPELISVTSIYIDSNDILWVGSWGQGLFRLDPSTVKNDQVLYTRYAHDPNLPPSLVDNSIYAILEDRNGVMWFGTASGLDRFDVRNLTFIHHQEKNGLINNTVLCLEEDQDGKLWISTNGGISKYDPQNDEYQNFNVQDGLQSNEFNSGACGKSKDGTLFFGGQQGMNAFQPAGIQVNRIAPSIALKDFRVFNEPANVDLSGQTPIQLSYNQDFIAFDFVALDFHAPQKNLYAYKLEGFDQDWIEAGTRRYASYTNLPGGNYIFRVRASNNNGVWNEDGISIPIHVTPPFWETWWFQLTSIIVVVGAIGMGIRWRFQNIRERNRQLETLVGQRTTELSHTNQRLEKEVDQRKRAEEALAQKAQEDLQKSEARTNELTDINLRLREEIEQRLRAEKALAQKAADEAVFAERNRLARDLHDAVTQTLFSASLLAEVIPQLWEINQTEARKRLVELRELTRGALAEMRTLLLELRPSALTDTALPDLLRQLCEAIIGRSRLPIDLEINGERQIPPEVQVAFYRIAQEALNNTAKYAKATKVSTKLSLDCHSVRLTIIDNGIGFDPDAVPPNHLGLKIMRERAGGIDAQLKVRSKEGEGTQVDLLWRDKNKGAGN